MNQASLNIVPKVISKGDYDADTQKLISTCLSNPNDTVYAQVKVSRTTGGRQIDVDDFESSSTEEIELSLEATYKDNTITITGIEDDDVVLEINDIEV